MKLLLVFLALMVPSLTTVTTAAQPTTNLQVLALACVTVDPAQEYVVQFERETFPTFADTGLFSTRGQELLYVERGQLTIVGDAIGKTVGGEGFSQLVGENSTLGLRNDALDEASVLWLRLLPGDAAQAAAYMSPGALRANEAMSELQKAPLFFEFPVSEIAFDGRVHLFMAHFSEGKAFAPDALGSPLINHGLAFLVVEGGQLVVSDSAGITHPLAEGQAMTVIDGDFVTSAGPGPVSAFLVGLAAPDDSGLVGTTSGFADRNTSCPAS